MSPWPQPLIEQILVFGSIEETERSRELVHELGIGDRQFDYIASTDGPELAGPKQLEGDAPAKLWDELSAHLTAKGYTVSREALSGGLGGYTDPRTMQVVIGAQQSPLQQ